MKINNLLNKFILSVIFSSLLFSQITVNPTELHFGSASIGTSITKTLTITNNGTGLLSVQGITSEDNQFYATPIFGKSNLKSSTIRILFELALSLKAEHRANILSFLFNLD